MNLLLNILWLILGGFISAILFFLLGVLWAITLIGIPIALQCFKFAKLSLWPFGKDIEWSDDSASLIVNILWLIFGGIEMAISELIIGLLLCVTLIGIPFGLQHFKFARLALMPIGARIVPKK